MRKTRIAAVAAMAAAAALTLSACGGGGGGAASDKIKIGIKFDQPGVGYKDGNEYKGFDVDVAKYVANELGYPAEKIEFISTPSANRETALQNKQVDMIFASYSITDKRKESVAFAGPYLVAGQDLLVPVDSTITGPEDLDGKTLCSVTGSTSAQKVKDTYARASGCRSSRATPNASAACPAAPSTPSPPMTSSSPAWPRSRPTRASSRSSASRSARRSTGWA